mmetsp:Transcript_37761/g.70887  ORF Transcript_37761/g.70887 Transcript_37761/m.70887 type:complete len:114 (-) Transcript_37761:715-1056(-)
MVGANVVRRQDAIVGLARWATRCIASCMEEDCAANTRAAISLTRETPDCVASMGGEHGVQIVTATSLQLVVACTAWLMVVVLAVNMTGAADAQQGGATASSACLTEAAFGAIT